MNVTGSIFIKNLFGSQIPVTTGGFELPISCIKSRYLTLWPSGLGNDFVCKRFAVQTLLWSLEFVIQINLSSTTPSQFKTWLQVKVSQQSRCPTVFSNHKDFGIVSYRLVTQAI